MRDFWAELRYTLRQAFDIWQSRSHAEDPFRDVHMRGPL